MAQTLRFVGAMAAAIVFTLILLIAVEFYSSIVHPTPADFDGSVAQMCQHVENYPHWVLATVVPMWGAIAFLGVWVAGRIGNRSGARVFALLLVVALFANIFMLPYPFWFKVAQPIAILAAVALALRGVKPLKESGFSGVGRD